MYPTFEIVFTANDLECSTKINAANWVFALEAFWKVFDLASDINDIEILTLNGEEPYEWQS